MNTLALVIIVWALICFVNHKAAHPELDFPTATIEGMKRFVCDAKVVVKILIESRSAPKEGPADVEPEKGDQDK